MTLGEYRKKHKLTYDDLAKDIKAKSKWSVRSWCEKGYLVELSDGMIKIKTPQRTVHKVRVREQAN